MTIKASRREFLKRAASLSASGVATPLALNLAAIGQASAAAATGDDYKALVCVFLEGGNDHNNTVVPFDAASYGKYKTLRSGVAIPQSALLKLKPRAGAALPGGRDYALPSEMSGLAKLFNEDKKLAVLLNIGTLIQPTTKAQWLSQSVPLPPKLFSHNDQKSLWQSCSPEGASTGWAGRMGDFLADQNQQAVFTCINADRNVVFMTGNRVKAYRVGSKGAVNIKAINGKLGGSAVCSQVLTELITGGTRDYVNSFRDEYAIVTERSINAGKLFNAAIDKYPAQENPPEEYSKLDQQFEIVARAIKARGDLGVKRQVFFVQLGGFDTHDGLNQEHPELRGQVSRALERFYRATVEMGVADKVTTFTASDFGRSWGNDDGSDHGWGSHHFVLGGAVKGGQYLGKAPEIFTGTAAELKVGGADDVGYGRLLPSTSVEQLGATLAKWMGVSDADIATVFENINNWNASSRSLPIFLA
ncbi:MAG: hypothetical protein RIR70_1238 [Pseudomonadota bacterium]|jgi:uncharacterized protein (DUF1501 family)